MALDLGTLITRFGADTEQLDSAVSRSQAKLQSYGRQGRRAVNTMGKIGAAAAAAGAAIAGKLVSEQLRAVGSTTKLARSLDISTQTAVAYSKAFRDVGLDTDDVADALGTLADRSQDAVDGMQSMTDDFKLVGLSVDDLRGKNPEQLFNTMARAVANTEDPTRRTAAVVRTFGDDLGRKLMPLLMEGPAALDEYRRKVDELGLSFSQLEGAQIEQANKSLRDARDAVTGVARQLTIELAPIIRGITKQFTSAAREAGGMGAVIEAAVNRAVQVVGIFADGLHGLRIAFAGLKVIATGFSAAFWTVIEELARGMVKLGATINSVINGALRAFNAIPGVGDIPLLSEDINPPFLQRLESIGSIARKNLGDAKQAMHELAMQPLPSDQIEQWVADVRQGSEDAAKAAAAARAKIGGGATGGGDEEGDEGGDAADEATAKRRRRMQQEMELMRAKLEGERAMQNLHYQKQIEQLRKFRELDLITKQEFDELEAQAHAKHQQRLTEIQKEQEERRKDLAQRAWNVQRNAATGALSDITSVLGAENDKQTKIQKAAAVARAVMTGWEAAVNAWNAGMSVGGPAAPAVAAAYTAASLAKTAAQINNIRSAGSGSGGAGGGGGTGGAGTARQAQQQQEPRREATINVQGDSFGGETISRLAEELGDFMTDGGRLGRVNVQRS